MSPRTDTTTRSSAIPDASPDVIARCRQGDLAAFEELYHQYKSFMYSLALRFHGNRFDAEDSVQEAFLSLYRNIGSFSGRARFTTWLYRVLLNACIDRRRRSRSSGETRDFTLESVHPGNIPNASDSALRDALLTEIARLPALHRAVFLLCAAEEFTHQEIAETLDIRVGTSKSYYHRARMMLRKRITARGIRLEDAR